MGVEVSRVYAVSCAVRALQLPTVMLHTALTRALLTVSFVIPVVGCDTEVAPAPTDEALHVERHDANVLRGSFGIGDLRVVFDSEMPRHAAATVAIDVGDDHLTLFADAESGEIRVAAGGATLSRAEVDALGNFARAVDNYIGGAEDLSIMHESMLVSASGYFAAAPADTQLRDVVHLVGGLGVLGDEGKVCIKPGQVRTTYFDGDRGNHAETWTVGSSGGTQWNGNFDCMGRCGVGCGSYDWTQDCLEHDACSRNYYASSGAIDQNCGDEYSDAADDYTAFWKRCYR